MTRHVWKMAAVVVAVALLSACAAGRAFRRGEAYAREGDWDAAVAYYTRALQASPNRAEYRIALERATLNASRAHFDRAREFEQKDQLDAALREYRKASEFDATNRQAAAKVVELERTIRERIEAARPRPVIEQLRERARQATQEPLLNPASRQPLGLTFTNAALKDILNFIANASGINITYDRDYQDRPYSVQLDGVTLEQALSQILTANTLFYKVLNERGIIVVPDSQPKRAQYEEQVVRTFYISHADVTELSQMLNQVARLPAMAVPPVFAVSKTANTVTMRGSAALAAIVEKIIEANDKPRAEIVVDVQILEVNRTRAKQFGIDLSQYAVGTTFSPEVPPPGFPSAGGGAGGGTGGGSGTAPFNLNTISAGISTADFYLSVPSAVIRFLETDSQTKLVAKPQLRGTEGTKLTLNLGDDIPVPSTAFTPLLAGGAAVNPLTSFNYRPVGVILEVTPRVTFEGDIILELTVESSSLGRDVNIAGQNLPSFGSRKVTTKLRLRDGESNLLAGLLREDERRSLRGFPGAIRIPILKQLFSANDTSIAQTDIVMLLTPRVVRSHELTQKDLSPIYIGTQQNIGLGGPPPLIAPPPGATPDQGPAGAQPAQPGAVPAPPVTGRPPTGLATPPPSGRPPRGQAETPVRTPTQPPSPEPPAATPATPSEPVPPPATAAQILVSPAGTEFRLGGGPYMVPISITGAGRVSTITITLNYNPAALRVRAVQEGSFMRQGGSNVAFTHQVDSEAGRIDFTLTRGADATGASGSGLLAAVVFDPVAAGTAALTTSGMATMPGGPQVALQFSPVSVVVR